MVSLLFNDSILPRRKGEFNIRNGLIFRAGRGKINKKNGSEAFDIS